MRGARSLGLVMVLMVCLFAALGLAQEESVGEEVAGGELPDIALVGVEVSGGYSQFVGGRMTYKQDAFGFALSAAYDQAGVFAALQGRAYLPLDTLLPVYLGVGGGLLQSDFLLNVGAGTHVPLGLDGWRLSVEAGTNWVLADEGGIQPYGSVALGYSFAVDPATISTNRRRSSLDEASNSETCTPSSGDLTDVISGNVSTRIASTIENLGDGVSNIEWSYSDLELDIDGDEAKMDVKWKASADVSGDNFKINGKLSAEFGWEPCSWFLIDYDLRY